MIYLENQPSETKSKTSTNNVDALVMPQLKERSTPPPLNFSEPPATNPKNPESLAALQAKTPFGFYNSTKKIK